MIQRIVNTAVIVLGVAIILMGCATVSEAAKPKAEDLLQQAIAADNNGDLDQAVSLYQQAVKAKSKLGEAHYRLAMLYSTRNMMDEAISEMKTARDLKFQDSQKQLGIIYHKAGKLDEAEAIYKELLIKEPNNLDLRYLMGKVALDKGNLNEAGEAFRQVLQIDPNYGAAHNGLANLYYRKRMFNDAMAEYQQALQLNPDLAEAYLDLGNAYYAKGQFAEAAQNFKRYSELAPKEAAGWFMLARAYQAQKDESLYQQGIETAQRAIKLDPTNDGAWYMLATFYRDGKEYDKSAAAFSKALELSPVDPERWYEAGKVYVKAGSKYQETKDTVRAKAYLDSAIVCYGKRCELDPTKVEDTYYDMGTAYYLSGDYDKAIEWYKKRIAVNPKTAYGVYLNLGYSYSLKGQRLKAATPEAKTLYLEAVNAFAEARKLQPDKVQPMEAIAQHYVFIGQKFNDKTYIAKAKAMIKEIRKIDPRNKMAGDLEQALKPKIDVW